ncbi:MAG: HDOD domain-containing protein [Deltaproteobacteria bacterium]|jgi:HD-like signal output (HDOD) protein|nr:HDOD domain-containing protein [Deltaproteobacteria bacterium]
MVADLQNNAEQEAPNKKDLEILQKRFALVDLNDPVYKTLFSFVSEQLPREGTHKFYHRKSSSVENQEHLAPLDPINIVQMDVKLPTMPTVLGELQAVTNNEFASASTVGEVIAKDPSLTAWVLKLVNSPFFGFSVKVDTVTRAVALLGVEQIKTLAISGMLQNLVVRMPKGIINLDDFWRHSIATSIAAQSIWKLMGKDDSERLFVAGLLHDCGILALAYTAPDIAKSLGVSCRSSSKQRYIIEQERISFDHARLGGMLLHRWNMPLPLVMAVLRHHQVESPERYPEAAVVHLADIIAFAVAGVSAEDVVPPIDPAVWKSLQLDQSKINLVADSILEKLNDLCSALRL